MFKIIWKHAKIESLLHEASYEIWLCKLPPDADLLKSRTGGGNQSPRETKAETTRSFRFLPWAGFNQQQRQRTQHSFCRVTNKLSQKQNVIFQKTAIPKFESLSSNASWLISSSWENILQLRWLLHIRGPAEVTPLECGW